MAGGGSRTTTQTQQTRNPWAPAIPYATDALARAQAVANAPAQTFPGPLTVGPTEAENTAWQRQFSYDQGVYGPAPHLAFGDTAGAYRSLLGGGAYGGAADMLTPIARELASGPARYGEYGLNIPGMTPQFGTAGTLDARSAIQNMLSGQPDYESVQGAISAANAPILRQFEQDILPALNTRATFLNNPTGGYKTLSRVLPDIGQRMSENAAAITEGERQRALSSQAAAANLVGQGGLSAYGLGLQGASDLARLGLSRDQAAAASLGDYRSQLLGLGGLGADLAGGASGVTAQALGLSPSIYGLSQAPVQSAMSYADWDRRRREQQLGAEQQQFQYLRDYPMQMASWYGGLVPQYAGLGGDMTGTESSRTRNRMGVGDWVKLGLGIASL